MAAAMCAATSVRKSAFESTMLVTSTGNYPLCCVSLGAGPESKPFVRRARSELLLDTHVWLWLALGVPKKIPPSAMGAIR
jgi:hypothetical protein